MSPARTSYVDVQRLRPVGRCQVAAVDRPLRKGTLTESAALGRRLLAIDDEGGGSPLDRAAGGPGNSWPRKAAGASSASTPPRPAGAGFDPKGASPPADESRRAGVASRPPRRDPSRHGGLGHDGGDEIVMLTIFVGHGVAHSRGRWARARRRCPCRDCARTHAHPGETALMSRSMSAASPSFQAFGATVVPRWRVPRWGEARRVRRSKLGVVGLPGPRRPFRPRSGC